MGNPCTWQTSETQVSPDPSRVPAGCSAVGVEEDHGEATHGHIAFGYSVRRGGQHRSSGATTNLANATMARVHFLPDQGQEGEEFRLVVREGPWNRFEGHRAKRKGALGTELDPEAMREEAQRSVGKMLAP